MAAERVHETLPHNRELWRVDYIKDAYADQTGRKHWGNVVYERVFVDCVARFDQYEGYSEKWVPQVGIIAMTPAGVPLRVFAAYQNLVDYWGGRGWQEQGVECSGHWIEAPSPTGRAGYVNAKGQAV